MGGLGRRRCWAPLSVTLWYQVGGMGTEGMDPHPHIQHHGVLSHLWAPPLPTQACVVKLLSHVWLFATPWTAVPQASLFFTLFLSSLKLMSTESVMPSNYVILCCRLFLPPSTFPSIRVFSNESALGIRWPKYWSFSFNVSPSNEYSGLVSFRIGWFDLLAVQGTLKSLLQHHSSFKSINSSAFSLLYSPTVTPIHDYWKNHSFDKTDLC